MVSPFRPKPLTRTRIMLAVAVAIVADGLQFGGSLAGGPLAWAGFVQAVDVIAMILTVMLLGFHVLLLPTFVVELFPVVDMLPTWTGCVGAVILMRGRSQPPPPSAPPTAPPVVQAENQKPPAPTGPVIDV